MTSTTGVNRPTDPKLRDQDIDKKLQIYGIVTAFGNGKVPTNQQIDVAMNSALAWKPMASPPSSLSREGQQLVADLRDVIEKAKILLLSKNDGNLIQDFQWQTRSIGTNNVSGVKSPIDQGTAKQQGNQALEDLRTLGELLITNGQFRKLLSDASILLRDVAGDAATKASDKVNPSEDQLNQIDQPADDNVFHETPDFSKETLKQRAQEARSRVPIGQQHAEKAVGDATQTAHPSGARDPATAADRDVQARDTTGVSPTAGAKQGLASLQNQASANMNEEDKQKMREQKERAQQRAREYIDKKMPQERREQVIYRLKKMIVECQDHPEYQRAIDSLLRLAEEYQGHAKNAGQQAGGAVQGGRDQGPVKNAEYDLKTILERFANSTSFDDVIESINQIYRDADQDPDLKNFFKNLDAYIRKCLKQTGFVLEDRATQEYNQLYEQGRFLLRERYKQHTDKVVDEIKYVADQFDRDPQNQAFARSMEKLFYDLGHDETGQQAFKPHLLEDLKDVILPGLFKTLGYIPVPRIEYSDSMIDAVVENLILEGDNLAPNVLEIGSDNYWRWSRGVQKGQNRNKNTAMFAVEGIQMDIQDVAYYIKKKQGFPAVTDKGVMDIFFGGTGISFKVAMETADKSGDQHHFFKIKTVTIDIQNMDIKLKQSNHKLLFNLFKPLLIKVVRPVVQKVLEKQIRDQVTKLDAICYDAKKQADREAEAARRNPDPDNQKSIYQRYVSAFQNQMSLRQQPKSEPDPNKQSNVALTQNDSILKNISLPGGFSTKATKYNDMAKQGEKWTSPVFSIGSASGSGNISATKVSRRTGGLPQSTGTTGTTTQGSALDRTGYVTSSPSTQPPSSGQDRVGYLDPGRPNPTEEYRDPNTTGAAAPGGTGNTMLGREFYQGTTQ